MHNNIARPASFSEAIDIVAQNEQLAKDIRVEFDQARHQNIENRSGLADLNEPTTACEVRVGKLEQALEHVTAAEPEVIVEALSAWLKRDGKGLAEALRSLIREAISNDV